MAGQLPDGRHYLLSNAMPGWNGIIELIVSIIMIIIAKFNL